MKASRTQDLESGNIKALFWKYALPSMAMMIIMSVYFIVDAIFIGRGVGNEALGAVNLIIPMMIITNSLTMSLAIGASIVISIYLSKKNYKKANNAFVNVVVINTVISLIFTILGLCFSKQIAVLLGATPDTVGMVVEYLSIILYFIFFFNMQATLSSIIRNDGNPNLAMIATIVSCLINIPLDALFIFGFKWGITGTALATGLSQFIAVTVLSFHFILKKGDLRFSYPKFRFRDNKKIFINAVPIMLGNIFLPVSMFLMNHIASKTYGTLGLSAFAIISSISVFIIMALNGVAQGIQPIISFNYGQKQLPRIKDTLRLGIKNGLIIVLLLTLGLYFFSDQIIGLFTTSGINSPLFKLTKEALHVYMLGFVFIGFNSILASYFQSIEHVKNAIIINTLRAIVLLIPVSMLIPLLLPNKYIWSTVLISEFIISVMLFSFYYKDFTKKDFVKKDFVKTGK